MKKFWAALLLIILTIFSSSCSGSGEVSLFLGSALTLSLYTEGGGHSSVKACEAEIKNFLREFELAVSANIAGSEISRFNALGAEGYINLSPHVFAVFKRAAEIYDLTEGAFNPFMRDLSELWGFGYDGIISGNIPSDDEINSLLQNINAQKASDLVEFNGGRAIKKRGGVKVDLGAIAKGYAVGVCRQIAEKHGISYGIINIAGNLYVINRFKDKEKDTYRQYNIAITDPRMLISGSADGIFAKALVEENSVSVSGDYERYFLKEGKRYCHILGKDGRSVNNGVISVVTIGKNAADMDAFATAAMVMGAAKGKDFLKEQNVDAVIITESEGGGLYYTVCGNVTLEDIYEAYTEYTV